MDRQALITRFEAELGKVNRPGIDKLKIGRAHV